MPDSLFHILAIVEIHFQTNWKYSVWLKNIKERKFSDAGIKKTKNNTLLLISNLKLSLENFATDIEIELESLIVLTKGPTLPKK